MSTTGLLPALDRLFDDAALFPPARRPMAEALAEHESAVRGVHGHLVGPFLCPVTRLEELDACVAAGLARPSDIGVIAYDGVVAWRRVVARSGVVQVEAPLSADVPDVTGGRVHRYLELPPGGSEVQGALDRIAASRARAKARCGGLTPDATPSCEWLAEVVAGCAERGVVLKATAGLHHPFRHRDATTGVAEHGFVNLLAAATVALGGASTDEVAAVLATESPEAQSLLGQVDARCRNLLASIGTCSIDEPVADLRALDVL